MKPIHGNTLDLDLLEQELSLFQQSISDVHSDLQGYHRVVEELLAEAESKEAAEVQASVDHLQESRRSKLLAMRYPYWWSQTFVPQFRASFAVWAISVLELHLEWASRLAGGFAQTPLACADLAARSTVARYEKFFSRLAGFEAPANDAWSRLANVYIIRNALAHSGSYVMFEPEEKRKRLETANRGFRGIAINHVVFEVDAAFCEDVVDLVCSFCRYLSGQLARAREAFLLRNPG